MKPEGGVTEVSLENARELLAEYGRPLQVRCYQQDWETYVETTWIDGMSHTFSGFGWGYGGTAPDGLAEFFQMIGIEVTSADLAEWPTEDAGDITYVIGEDY